jgi:hypothetical protein
VKKKALRVFLTGGLGNQLFQLAAAMHYAGSRKIELDVVTASPRKNKNGEAEILSLNLPEQIEILEKNEGTLARKVFGFNIRSGYLPSYIRRSSRFKTIQRFCSAIALGITLKRIYRINISSDLGNDSEFISSDRDEIIIGYFQTYKVASEIQGKKEQLFRLLGNEEYLKYESLAQAERPLLVHVRLGDYELEDDFGVLNTEYYRAAIEFAWRTEKFGKIWLFSDQPEDAMQRIPSEFRDRTRLVEDHNLDSAETLQIMSLCQGYVIANSSFSWWGAFLSECKDPLVVTPKPWFTGLPEPTDLIPLNWNRFDGFNSK